MESRNYNHPSVRRLRHARFHLTYQRPNQFVAEFASIHINSEIAFIILLTEGLSNLEKANHFLPKSLSEAPR